MITEVSTSIPILRYINRLCRKRNTRSFVWKVAQQTTGRNFNSEYSELQTELSHESYLNKLLRRVYDIVPYYSEVLGENGAVNSHTVDLSRFSEIRILTIEIIREHFNRPVSKDCAHRKWYYNSSGGSILENQ